MAGVRCAAAVLATIVAWAALPTAASAQTVEISYTKPASLERVAVFAAPGDSLPRMFDPSPTPFRLVDSFEDTDEDRGRRADQLALGAALKPVPGITPLDVIFGLPNGLIETVVGGICSIGTRAETISLCEERERSLLPRLLAGGSGISPRAFDDFVTQFVSREQKYFARFQDSALSTFGVEDGTAEVDRGAMMDDQRKIAFDAAKKLYLGGFGSRLDERVREEAFDIGRWHPVDFVAGPAILAGYLYIRGWEKKVGMGPFECRIQVEPLRRILERLGSDDEPLVSAASVEIGVGNFPIKAIVSVGLMDGDPLFDFVGIGTSLGKAKQAVRTELAVMDDP
jgi:hypothetical protein